MMKQAFLYVLLRDMPDHSEVRKLYGNGNQMLKTLAKVLACDSRWKDMENATLIIRFHPSPVLGVMGYFDKVQRARIEALSVKLKQALDHLRYIDYHQAEKDCQKLADCLIQEIGTTELKDFCFAPIPRGGLIVMGMLAYLLDLSPNQLHPSPGRPLIIVDDCSISGFRFRQFLNSYPNDKIVFASLYAHPLLKEAIKTREPRVIMCLSARNFQDYASMYCQDDYENWYSRCQRHSSDEIYWMGIPEHICFAWNEPDIGIWNPIAKEREHGWHVVPQSFCLKNRIKYQQPILTIQYQSKAKGVLKPDVDVLVGELANQIVVANIKTGTNISLRRVAADMWRAIINTVDLEAATKCLLRLYHVDEPILKADLYDFAAMMQKQGILVK
jgi:hypothetical protein